MNWASMQTHNEAQTRAFEIICNQLFDNWSTEEYKEQIISRNIVNGAGGDGGVESFVTLKDGSIIGLQAKWFIYSLQPSQINQIKKSVDTAIKLRPKITQYIVCLPRDLSNKTDKSDSCEQVLWDNLINKLASLYPNVKIELWNDYRITNELQKSTSEGILKYWFSNSNLSYENIEFAFEKSCDSWLSSRYVPDLNSYGQIYSSINSFIGDNEEYQLFIKRTNQALASCQAARKHIADLVSIKTNQSDEIKNELNLALQNVLCLENSIALIREWLLNSNSCPPTINESIFYIQFENLIEILGKKSFGSKYYFHALNVERDLKKLTRIDSYQIYQDFKKLSDKTSILFLGEPGTGKTQGIAAVAEKILENHFHIVIVIQAKDIDNSQTWFDLIRTNLGLPSTWSETELWQALVTTADQNSYLETLCETTIISPKVLILVDGIDESSAQNKWIERMNETRAIIEKYPRVRFCFTSRPYGFLPSEYINIKYLSPNGDVSPCILFDKYLKHYNIKIENDTSIKYQITTPLTLKLFCELYANQTIDLSNEFDLSLSGLLQKKIDLIEESFSAKSGHSIKQQLVFNSIALLTEEFITNGSIEHKTLVKKLSLTFSITDELSNILIEFLERYGILRCYCNHTNNFEEKLYYYYPGLKGYFDYATSIILLKKYQHPQLIDFNQCTTIDRNALYGLAIISIQKYDYLIVCNKTINKVANNDLIHWLFYCSLQNAPIATAQVFKPNILEIMKNSSDDLINTVNNIILPLSRNTTHPLGVSILDEFLFAFDKPAHRDIIWSSIGYLKTCSNKKWNRRYSLDFENEAYKLNEEDTYNGCPTIYAWALSSLNNTLRKKYRDELMRWALLRPNEFYKLFEKFATVNDPQIRNDVFAIMMCLVYETTNIDVTEKAYKWISENILDPKKIDTNRDISIRYYAIAIAYKASNLHIISETELCRLLPPYDVYNNDILLNRDALKGNRMSGYSEIHYNLSRYVLVDNIEGSFDYYKDSQRNKMNDFVNEICNRYFKIDETVSLDQFVISAAYAYIKSMGWDESSFYSREEDENGHYVGGIDKDISGTYYRADHGAQSNVMTVCEKYVWMARNEIYGFLCDRIRLPDNSYFKDYGLIDDFINPMQEIQNDDYEKSQELPQWFIPQNIAHLISNINTTSEDIIKFIKAMPTIQWNKWIQCNNPQYSHIDAENIMALYGYNYFSEENIDTCLAFSTLIIREADLTKFISCIHNKDLLAHLHSIDDLLGGIAADCYVTPKEICWFTWKEHDDSWILENINVESHCAVDHCCYNLVGSGDCEMNLPAPYIREKLKISNLNGNLFYDSFNKIKAEYYSIGESLATEQQYLWVDKDELIREIKKDKSMLVWIMKIHRQESCLAREKFDGICTDASQLFIGYFENGRLKTKKIFDSQNIK